MMNSQVVGSVRTYVKVRGAFTYRKWIHGFRVGRSFTTTAPILSLSANGRGLGETMDLRPGKAVMVRARVESFYPVDRFEIVIGREVVAAKTNGARHQSSTLDVKLTCTQSTWIAARAYGGRLLPYQAFELEGLTGVPRSPTLAPFISKPAAGPRAHGTMRPSFWSGVIAEWPGRNRRPTWKRRSEPN